MKNRKLKVVKDELSSLELQLHVLTGTCRAVGAVGCIAAIQSAILKLELAKAQLLKIDDRTEGIIK